MIGRVLSVMGEGVEVAPKIPTDGQSLTLIAHVQSPVAVQTCL